jgi:hypothetical protein
MRRGARPGARRPAQAGARRSLEAPRSPGLLASAIPARQLALGMSFPENPAPPTGAAHVRSDLGARRSAWLREDFFESYVRWRQACEEVRQAYEHWSGAERCDRGLAFAAFCAALDREGQAANVHAECARTIRESSAG